MRSLRALVHGVAVFAFAACASRGGGGAAATNNSKVAPSPDPRVGLKAGRYDAGQAQWNMKLVSNNPSPSPFDSSTNSDLAFYKNYVIQGSYDGFQVWDISTPGHPTLKKAYYCPASQSDVSVFRNLLFVSGEGTGGRLDCTGAGVRDSVSHDRLRGIRIFDITDIANPKYIANVQTCRGSHTHTVVIDPNDSSNVYVYVSGSAPVRSPTKLLLDSIAKTNDRTAPNGADSAALHTNIQGIVDRMFQLNRQRTGPNQCHDITVYPAIGLAGGACGGYGLLLDIRDAAHPRRIGAVSDSNFSYWHSATFNNDGTKILFSDEWGGGGQPKCRSFDKPEWGADALFTVNNGQMQFQSYYKMLAPQTPLENCVAHNGSLIPVPGRDIMVQSWYQGGVSIFDWTDAAHPKEVAFFDRGPVDG